MGDKKKDTQSRKWLITINNPKEKGYTRERLKEIISDLKNVVYWCMSDEVGGKTQTYHTHLYLHFTSGRRFSTIQKRFPNAHYDMAKGTAAEVRDYVFKEGEKWENDKKADTNLRDTHEENGEIPFERQGARNDLHELLDMLEQGYTDYEIIQSNPNFILDTDKIRRARMVVKMEKFKKEWRDVHVTYIYGKTGTGKTRGVMEKHDFEAYRITDYKHPFEAYEGQEAVVFDEFRSDLKIGDMLNYLDGYPLQLPARYSNVVACFKQVYIISNIGLKEQYANVQESSPETYRALLRRINEVHYYDGKTVHVMTAQEAIDFENMQRHRTEDEIENILNLAYRKMEKDRAANAVNN